MLVCATGILSGCKEEGITPTGEACMGTDNDSLVEGLEGKCQKGDIIATKHPAYFCDFKSEIALNNYNSVDSICQCNTPFNYLFRCFELQCLSRSVV